MAAYASLVSLAQTIDKLQQQYDQDFTFLPEKQQIRCLQEHLVFLQAFLHDFSEKLANDLEARIGNAASRAEDVIECFMSKGVGSSQKELRLRFDFQVLNQELREMMEEIDSIVEEMIRIKNSSRSTADVKKSNDFPAAIPSSSSMQLDPTSKDSSMVGFDGDLMAIKTRLCGESSRLQFIPIVGMGGIGKTTLARNAFNDSLTAEHFQIRAWVTVSQDYSAHKILSNLWFSINKFLEGGEGSNESIQEKVYKSLKGRRYLIVMDDLWSTEAWDDVRSVFPDDHNGSRIMLTTRLSDVAAYPDSRSPLHKMRFMDVNQSWNLLKQKVFVRGNCPPKLERIGKEIARGCRGVPLAIVVIAGVLSTLDKTRNSWNKIARNVSRAITRNDEQFARTVLSLSYYHLPHHLRPCFLHMGVFREDCTFRASKLIKLWVAEGFLKPPETCRSFEETGEAYLEDLVKRNLVLVIKRNGSGKIKRCCIHDLVRDLCIRKARDEKFLDHISRDRYGANLRVLDVVNTGGVSVVVFLPDEVFELFHLRYLALNNCLMNIPAAISNLQNLQTLIIHPRKKMVERCCVSLPSEIWTMPKIRHLISFSFGALPEPIGATTALENLQTLSEVTNLICSKEILKMIPNLKKLGILFKMNDDVEDYQLDNLVLLHQLENLKLSILSGFQRGVKQGLNPVFPTTLKKLTLRGSWGFSWKYFGDIVGSLPNLEVLKLRNRTCSGGKWETSEGGFLRLKSLVIKYSRLRKWVTESSHFPSLKCLKLYFCRYLCEIPDGIGEFPTLELIEVDFRNKTLMESARRIQKDQQENWGNYALQVRRAHRNLN